MSKPINVNLNEEETEMLISGLLFFSSVNVVSELNQSYQKKLVDLAIKLKSLNPKIKLKEIRFLKEENYEDEWSELILNNFKENINVTTFDEI